MITAREANKIAIQKKPECLKEVLNKIEQASKEGFTSTICHVPDKEYASVKAHLIGLGFYSDRRGWRIDKNQIVHYSLHVCWESPRRPLDGGY